MSFKQRKLSQRKLSSLLKYFAEDLPATQTARLVGVNRNTANYWYLKFREVIAVYQEEQFAKSSGEFELDESYFGGIKKRHTLMNEESVDVMLKTKSQCLVTRNVMAVRYIHSNY